MNMLVFIINLAVAQNKPIDPEILILTQKAAQEYNVSQWDLLKIGWVESNLNKNPKMRRNKNGTYDIGIMQINSIHWHVFCRKHNVKKIDGNIFCAAKLLAQHLQKSKTDANWVARYHSKTPHLKKIYSQKLYQAGTQLNFGTTLAAD